MEIALKSVLDDHLHRISMLTERMEVLANITMDVIISISPGLIIEKFSNNSEYSSKHHKIFTLIEAMEETSSEAVKETETVINLF